MIYTADTHILVIDTVTYILKNNRSLRMREKLETLSVSVLKESQRTSILKTFQL